jgi:hypothetical protein
MLPVTYVFLGMAIQAFILFYLWDIIHPTARQQLTAGCFFVVAAALSLYTKYANRK